MDLVRSVEIHRLDGDDNIFYSSVYNLNINNKALRNEGFYFLVIYNCD